MFSFSIFKEHALVKFKQTIKIYCEEIGYHHMFLTDEEKAQLYGYMDSNIVTPEARDLDLVDKLHFEIKRGLARRYSFELLLNGNNACYEAFIEDQDKSFPLSFSDFEKLSKEAQSMDDDLRTSLKPVSF